MEGLFEKIVFFVLIFVIVGLVYGLVLFSSEKGYCNLDFECQFSCGEGCGGCENWLQAKLVSSDFRCPEVCDSIFTECGCVENRCTAN